MGKEVKLVERGWEKDFGENLEEDRNEKNGNRGKVRKRGYRGKYWNRVNIERGKYRKREENMEKIRIDMGNLENWWTRGEIGRKGEVWEN